MISNIFRFLIAIFLIIGFSGCTEEIDVNLNSSDSVVVIEGVVSTSSEYSEVFLSRSKNFSATNDFDGIEGAYVQLSDDNGNSDVLEETSSGQYVSSVISGKEGVTYSMKVEVNDTIYTSSCKIPNMIRMDSVFMRKEISDSFWDTDMDTVFNFYIYYKDPADEDNYYQFVAYKNGEQVNSFVASDLTTDGLNVVQYITFLDVNSADEDDDEDEILENGDVVTVEMRCITKDVYEYFDDLSSSSTASTPTNPETNIDGAELGYFSAHTSEFRQFRIME